MSSKKEYDPTEYYPNANEDFGKESSIKQNSIEDNEAENEYKIDIDFDSKTPRYSPSIPDKSNQVEDEDDGDDQAYSPTYSPVYSTKTPLLEIPRTPYDSSDINRIKMEARSPMYTPKPIEPETEDLSYEPNMVSVNKNQNSDLDIAYNSFDIEEDGDNAFEGFERDENPHEENGIQSSKAPPNEGTIADIFGESDQEEEFEGFAENEVEEKDENYERKKEELNTKTHRLKSNEDSYSGDEGNQFISDFDQYLEKKKRDNRRKRRRDQDIELLNDSDDMIIACIKKMRNAAEADRLLFQNGKPAVKKVVLIPSVIALMKKAGLKNFLVENGMLSALTDWLSPLKGQKLPSLPIRENILKALEEFRSLPADVLKESGIGKAVMYLYKHPKETKENKLIAGKLINDWCRPIFNLQSDYKNMTKEERRKLTAEQLPKRRTFERDAHAAQTEEEEQILKPGEPGFVSRARVPQPSRNDYIVAPKWNLPDEESLYIDKDDVDEGEDIQTFKRKLKKKIFHSENSGGSRSQISRIENNIRNLTKAAHVNARKKFARAVNMSVEGRKMAM